MPLRSIALRSLTVEGFVPTLEFGDLNFKLFWINATFWFRQCGDVIIYVIPHYLYSDIIVVWMWYSTGIWVIWSTTVLLHYDSMDFPSRKSGRFTINPSSGCGSLSSKLILVKTIAILITATILNYLECPKPRRKGPKPSRNWFLATYRQANSVKDRRQDFLGCWPPRKLGPYLICQRGQG